MDFCENYCVQPGYGDVEPVVGCVGAGGERVVASDGLALQGGGALTAR